RVDATIADEVVPVRMPAARADLVREGLDAISPRAADGRQLAPAAVAQRLGDALAHDVAGADQAPTNHIHEVLKFKRSKVQGSRFSALRSRFAGGQEPR